MPSPVCMHTHTTHEESSIFPRSALPLARNFSSLATVVSKTHTPQKPDIRRPLVDPEFAVVPIAQCISNLNHNLTLLVAQFDI